jgi:hypothetical protein
VTDLKYEKVTLPSGSSLMDNKGNYTAKADDTVYITDTQAKKLKEKISDPSRKLPKGTPNTIGTRIGRRCVQCRFLGQAWSIVCPHCGGETVREDD